MQEGRLRADAQQMMKRRNQTMKEIIQHATYGEIIYEEGFWTGKKTLTVGGVVAKQVAKKDFMLGEEKTLIAIKGNWFTGISLCIKNETIEVTPKPMWYEIILAAIPALFMLTWGNSPALCAMFPVIGGGIGGAIGGLFTMLSLLYMKKTKNPLYKVLIGLGMAALAILIGFVLAVGFIMLLTSPKT